MSESNPTTKINRFTPRLFTGDPQFPRVVNYESPDGNYVLYDDHAASIAAKDAEIAELSRHHAAEMLGHADAEREVERLKLERIGLHATINEWRDSHEKLTARNSELEAEVERLKESKDAEWAEQTQKLVDENKRLEASETKLVAERDEAEEALSQAYYLVTGKSPEWSNLFGNEQAHEEIRDVIDTLKDTMKSREVELADARKLDDNRQYWPWDVNPTKTCPPDCQRCSGEYCETHGADPCECDTAERHARSAKGGQ